MSNKSAFTEIRKEKKCIGRMRYRIREGRKVRKEDFIL